MTQIALQTATVKKQMKKEDEIIATLHKLNKFGIKCIEVAGTKFTKEEGEIIAQTCRKLGIKIGSTQIPYKTILKDFDHIVALNQMWACDYIGVSGIPMKYLMKGEKGIHQFALQLDGLGERLHQKGLKLLYNHHMTEFVKYGSKTGLELLMEETNPIYVNMMMDTYWTQKGGRNPVDQIHQFHQRIKVINLRDLSLKAKVLSKECAVNDAILGQGNLNIKSIIETAVSYKIPLLPIEQETKAPFEDVSKSIEYLKSIGFEGLF